MISKLIDDIRATIVQSSSADAVLVGEIAHDYTEAIVECNDRLRRVVGMIDQGHVTEAVSEADRSPALLEMVGQLEFPERDNWIALLARLSLDPPPDLRLDLAERLDETYATCQGIEGLMRKQRLLALTRSPLSSRIAIQRLICQRDSQNLVWKQDLALLERARLKQIEVEVVEGMRKRSYATLQGLQQELTSAGWTVSIPQELMRKVADSRQNLFSSHQREIIKQAGAELREAFLSYDSRRGLAALLAWRQAIEPLRLMPSDPLVIDHRDAIAWVEELEGEGKREAEFREALAALVEVMDRHGNLSMLDRAEYRVKSLELPIPPVTAERLRNYRRSLEFRRNVRLIGAAAAILVVAIALIALVWITVERMRIGEKAIEVAGRLDELLAKNEHQAAESLVDSLEESVRKHSAVAPFVGRIEAKKKEEETRLSERQSAVESVKQSGVESPDLKALQRARELSVSDSELEEVVRLELDIERRQLELKSNREEEFRLAFSDFEQRISEIENQPSEPEGLKSLFELRTEIQRLKAASSGQINGTPIIAESELARLETLLQTIDSVQKKLANRMLLMDAVEEVTQSVGNASDYVAELGSLSNTVGPGVLASDLEDALNEQKLWLGYEKWQELIHDTKWQNYPEWTDLERNEFSTSARRLLVESPFAEISDEVSALLAYGETDSRRRTLDPGRRLSSKVFQDVTIAKDSRDRLYHCVEAPKYSGNNVEIQFFLDDELSISRDSIPVTKFEDLGAAPQSRLFDKLEPILNAQRNGELSVDKTLLRLIEETQRFDIANELAGEAVDLDPILRLRLIRDLIGDIRTINPNLVQRHLRDYEDLIKSIGRDVDEDWLDPTNADAVPARERALAVVEQLPPIERLQVAISQLPDTEPSPAWPVCKYHCVGWLYRDSAGVYSVRHAGALENGAVYCLTLTANVGEFTSIGRVNAGSASLDGSGLVAGRLVYQKVAESAQ